MAQETNPFRLSMLRRSQSPLEDPFDPISSSTQEIPSIQHPALSRGSSNSSGPLPGTRQNNPFRVDLSDSPALSPGISPGITPEPSASLEPPTYFESEGRRHSEPSLTHPSDEKSHSDTNEDRYREGYEEGMRIARERERQRRREIRERRVKHSGDSKGATTSHVEHRSERSSRRSRSKSESAGHHHSSGNSRRKPKPGASLDVIDKMDVTGFYGGSGFHHDGPFDACAPHRNKTTKRNPATPISAFPVDGPNNSLAVEDPRLLAYRKEETVYGRNAHGDAPPEVAQNSFDPTERGAKVHGQRTMGLGSTTFIDGTPASRDAIAQAGRERSQSFGRSKSLRRKPATDSEFPDEEPKSLLSRVRSLRVTRH